MLFLAPRVGWGPRFYEREHMTSGRGIDTKMKEVGWASRIINECRKIKIGGFFYCVCMRKSNEKIRQL